MIAVQTGFGDLLQILHPRLRRVELREKFEVPMVGCMQHCPQRFKTVDRFLHRRPFNLTGMIPVVDTSEILEERHIVHRCFDAQDALPLVVHLDRHRAHRVFDAGAFGPDIEVVPHFTEIPRVQLCPEEGGDILRFDGVNQRFKKKRIKRLQVVLPTEHDIGGILGLHNAPVVGDGQRINDRAKAARKAVERGMEMLAGDLIGVVLRTRQIRDGVEGVLGHHIPDPRFFEATRQDRMPVTVNLQAERTPRRNSDVA